MRCLLSAIRIKFHLSGWLQLKQVVDIILIKPYVVMLLAKIIGVKSNEAYTITLISIDYKINKNRVAMEYQ